MPKLTVSQRTFGKAAAALLKLYKAEPGFRQELEELRTAYLPALEEWLSIAVPGWVQIKKPLSCEEFTAAKDYVLKRYLTISHTIANKFEFFLMKLDSAHGTRLEEYQNALTELAYRWHLRASWIGYALVLDHAQDMIFNLMPKDFKKAEIPIEMVETLLASAPLSPLRFEVNAYELMFSGRQEIQAKFAKALVEYEKKLKSSGWRELPSAIEKHASWWFEHYVHRKTYDEISQSEAYKPGGSPIAYARNVGTAVRNFARLIRIETVDTR